MTVKDAIDEIKNAKEYAKFLYALAQNEHDEHVKDYLIRASNMLYMYVDMLEQMKVQET